MKKILFALFVILTFTFFAAPAIFAAGNDNYVFDETGTLTSAQIESLNAKAAAISADHECNAYIWIVDLVPREYDQTVDDVEAYVDLFYERNGLGYGDDKNGMVLLLEIGDIPGERDYLFYTQGSCTSVFNNKRRESLLDNHIVPLFKAAFDNGNFFKVADTFLVEVESAFASLAARRDYVYHETVRNGYIFYETEVLTSAQIESLNEKAAKLSEKHKCGVYIWIVDLVPREYEATADKLESYVDMFYEKHDLGWGEKKNGMVLLLETGDIPYERDHWLYTHGPCKLIFHGGIRSDILYTHVSPPFYAAFDNGIFYEAADVFLSRVEKEFASDSQAELFNGFLFIVPAPMLIAWIVCSSWKRKLKTVKIARAADNYIPQGGFKLTGQTDKYLYRTTTRVEIDRDSSSSSKGGGGGGSSSSSSGRSSGGKV